MKKVFEYISSVSEKIFEVKKIEASIMEKKNDIEALKSQIEQLKGHESHVKSEISNLLSVAEDYGMTKKSVQLTSEDYVDNMIGNGILDVTPLEASVNSNLNVEKPRNPTKRKKKETVVEPVETVVKETVVEPAETVVEETEKRKITFDEPVKNLKVPAFLRKKTD